MSRGSLVMAIVMIPNSRAGVTARTTLLDRPEVDDATRTSPGLPRAATCRENTGIAAPAVVVVVGEGGQGGGVDGQVQPGGSRPVEVLHVSRNDAHRAVVGIVGNAELFSVLLSNLSFRHAPCIRERFARSNVSS